MWDPSPTVYCNASVRYPRHSKWSKAEVTQPQERTVRAITCSSRGRFGIISVHPPVFDIDLGCSLCQNTWCLATIVPALIFICPSLFFFVSRSLFQISVSFLWSLPCCALPRPARYARHLVLHAPTPSPTCPMQLGYRILLDISTGCRCMMHCASTTDG
jgi:hypothetical protein